MEKSIYNGWKTIQVEAGRPTNMEDMVATEFPLTFMLNGKEFATIVCTPKNIREMAVGFLASEGVIRFMDDIKSINVDDSRGFVYIELNKSLQPIELDHSKRFIGSCCGKSRQFYFKSDVQTAKTITSSLSLSHRQCYQLMEKMQAESTFFQATGGVHNAALCTTEEIIVIRTDIGRHNALDKLYGYMMEKHLSAADKIIVFSGRISSEVLLKVAEIG